MKLPIIFVLVIVFQTVIGQGKPVDLIDNGSYSTLVFPTEDKNRYHGMAIFDDIKLEEYVDSIYYYFSEGDLIKTEKGYKKNGIWESVNDNEYEYEYVYSFYVIGDEWTCTDEGGQLGSLIYNNVYLLYLKKSLPDDETFSSLKTGFKESVYTADSNYLYFDPAEISVKRGNLSVKSSPLVWWLPDLLMYNCIDSSNVINKSFEFRIEFTPEQMDTSMFEADYFMDICLGMNNSGFYYLTFGYNGTVEVGVMDGEWKTKYTLPENAKINFGERNTINAFFTTNGDFIININGFMQNSYALKYIEGDVSLGNIHGISNKLIFRSPVDIDNMSLIQHTYPSNTGIDCRVKGLNLTEIKGLAIPIYTVGEYIYNPEMKNAIPETGEIDIEFMIIKTIYNISYQTLLFSNKLKAETDKFYIDVSLSENKIIGFNYTNLKIPVIMKGIDTYYISTMLKREFFQKQGWRAALYYVGR